MRNSAVSRIPLKAKKTILDRQNVLNLYETYAKIRAEIQNAKEKPMEYRSPDEKLKILIVDDDTEIAGIIQDDLSHAGYLCITAKDGISALELLESNDIKLVIMDVMMPKLNGIAATVRIREKSNVPILMLSAKTEMSDKVIGLSSGADDYLSKPFYKDELLARVDALLRRFLRLGTNAEGDMVEYGDLRLDLHAHKLYVRGKEVSLTATEYKIMELMMKSPGRVFSAEQIYRGCRQEEAYSVENTVMIHMSRIRKKIEIDPSKPDYIKVVWGVGYKLEKQ